MEIYDDEEAGQEDPKDSEIAKLKAENDRLKATQRPASVPTPQQGQVRLSNLQRERETLIAEGVDPIALDRIIRIQQAELRDQLEIAKANQHFSNANQVVRSYWTATNSIIKEMAEKIPALENLSKRHLAALATEVSDAIELNKDQYGGIIDAMNRWEEPPTKDIKKVASKVLDDYMKTLGLTKENQPIPISSRRSTGSNASKASNVADISALGTEARKLYHQNLKVKRGNRAENTPEEKQKAFQLALRHEREVRMG